MVVGLLLVVTVATPAAKAGTIWVTDGNMNAGQTGSCNAFSFGGDLSVAIAPSSCPMSVAINGNLPEWQVASWSTVAPPGITINSAWTANGDVQPPQESRVGSSPKTSGYTGGAWHGSTLARGQQWFNTGLEGSPDINSQIYGFQISCTQTS